MIEATKNLTDANDIVAACKKKGGKNGVSACAEACGYKLPYISQHIHQVRETRPVLQTIANWLNCGVYGVMPEKPALPRIGKEKE